MGISHHRVSLKDPLNSSAVVSQAAIVVCDKRRAGSAVPSVVGPSYATVALRDEPIGDLIHIPSLAVILTELSNDKRIALTHGVELLLPAVEVVARVEVVEMRTCGQVVLGVVRHVGEKL